LRTASGRSSWTCRGCPARGAEVRPHRALYSSPVGLGTVINVIAVLMGGGIGTLVGARMSEGMRETAMNAIGLVTVLVGVQSFLRFDNVLVPLVSVIMGLVVGELLGVDAAVKRFGDSLERRFSKGESPVSRAFVTTSLLFCVGPLTILGSLRDGISGDYQLLALKSTLDFVASLSFASVLGWGVLLSAGSILVVQGGLTLAGALFGAFMDEPMVLAMASTGGVLLLGLGLGLLGLKEVRVANMLPALLVAPLLVALAPQWPF
jgi:uncharacterized membrane protein YqgA involved in biofilm formation